MIAVSHLSKRFTLSKSARKDAELVTDPRFQPPWFYSVRDVGFRCDQGEVLGLLGPNGAGKTTTLRMLSTALKPDSGSIEINGVDVVGQPLQARKKIGFLSAATGLYGRLTAAENILYFAKLHGLSAMQQQTRLDELVALLGMENFIHRRAEELSTGMKQKCAIARTVIHDPEVVILDEPGTGLDIMARHTLMNFISEIKAKGTPVIFSTHQFDEVEALCDRIAIINEGITQFEGSLDAFREQTDEFDLNAGFMKLVHRKEGV